MMTRRSTPVAFCLALLTFGLAASGCGKKRPTPDQQAAPAPVTPGAFTAEIAALPAETRVVLEARIAPLAASPVVGTLIDKVLSRDPSARARLVDLLARCKVDVARDLEQITIAMSEPTDVALIVKGRLDEPAVLACVKAAAGGVVSNERGGRTIHTTTGPGGRVSFVFANGFFIASSTDPWLEAVLDEKLPKLATRAETMALLGKVDREAALWGVGHMPAGVGDRLTDLTRGAVKKPARAVSFTVTTEKEGVLAAGLRLEMNDEVDARELATFAGSQLDLLAIAAQRFGLGRIVARTQIMAEGAGVKLALRLDENDVRLLEGALGQAPPKKDEKEQLR